jgi:FliI/YscN family ATPase
VRAVLPETWIGELCEIRIQPGVSPLLAEVVGFRGDEALLMPLGELRHIGTSSLVNRLDRSLTVGVGDGLVGRILDGLGRPADGRPIEGVLHERPVHAAPPLPLERAPITDPFPTGVRAIDGLLTLGEGQRVGVFAGAGVGKSTLLGMIARNAAADVVVIGLVGERGREVREFLELDLGPRGMSRSVAVVATSDQPALVRLHAARVATAVAEHFRDEGLRVLLLMDSITRFARALREVGLAAGEPPARAGYPPSVFAELPRLLERAGTDAKGSITAIYTVLVEGDDHNEPVADEARSILDGHIVLSADLAGRGFFPAIDVARSASRVMSRVATADHVLASRRVRSLLGAYERERDLILLGAYESGTDSVVDEAVAKVASIEAFLAQRPDENDPFTASVATVEGFAMPLDSPRDENFDESDDWEDDEDGEDFDIE